MLIKYMIIILRPLNMCLCFFAVITAAFLIEGLHSPVVPYAIFLVICFAGASNILNDILDINIDKINRPKRILPSKKLKIRSALILMIILYLLGIFASNFLHPLGQRIALLIAFPIITLYTPLFKPHPLLGNLCVGFMLGLVFLFTESSIFGSVDKLWIPFLLATTLSIIRELCKDAEDIEGDAVSNLHTFPRKYGLINTLWVIRLLSLLLCLISIIPFIHGNYGIIYLIILIIGVIIPLLYGTLFSLNNESLSSDYSKFSKILKGIVIAGLTAIFTSKF